MLNESVRVVIANASEWSLAPEATVVGSAATPRACQCARVREV